MGQVIGEFLPLAVGVAGSPIPVIAVILMLFSGRARQNSLAFLVGWVVGIAATLGILIAIASANLSTGGEPSETASWIKLILGVLLLLAAVKEWRAVLRSRRCGKGGSPPSGQRMTIRLTYPRSAVRMDGGSLSQAVSVSASQTSEPSPPSASSLPSSP